MKSRDILFPSRDTVVTFSKLPAYGATSSFPAPLVLSPSTLTGLQILLVTLFENTLYRACNCTLHRV